MTVFVSYAKSDIAADEIARVAKLRTISDVVTERLGPAFVDEVHNCRGAQAAVEAALDGATSFCFVRGDAYASGQWTRWEYQRALQRRLPMYEFSYANLTVHAHHPTERPA